MSKPKVPHKPWTQLEAKDIQGLRFKILKEQHNKCGICGTSHPDTVWTLDHSHAKGFGGTGLIRGVLCRNCNSAEGKIVRALRRFGVKIEELSDWLRNLADWLDKPHYPFIHPTEKVVVKITKTNFKILMKKYLEKYPKRAVLKYPIGGKANARLQEIIKEFNDND